MHIFFRLSQKISSGCVLTVRVWNAMSLLNTFHWHGIFAYDINLIPIHLNIIRLSTRFACGSSETNESWTIVKVQVLFELSNRDDLQYASSYFQDPQGKYIRKLWNNIGLLLVFRRDMDQLIMRLAVAHALHLDEKFRLFIFETFVIAVSSYKWSFYQCCALMLWYEETITPTLFCRLKCISYRCNFHSVLN